jgi:predicted deacylase
MWLERTQIRNGIQAILLKVIELGRFNKSNHPNRKRAFPSNYAGSIVEKQRKRAVGQFGGV